MERGRKTGNRNRTFKVRNQRVIHPVSRCRRGDWMLKRKRIILFTNSHAVDGNCRVLAAPFNTEAACRRSRGREVEALPAAAKPPLQVTSRPSLNNTETSHTSSCTSDMLGRCALSLYLSPHLPYFMCHKFPIIAHGQIVFAEVSAFIAGMWAWRASFAPFAFESKQRWAGANLKGRQTDRLWKKVQYRICWNIKANTSRYSVLQWHVQI